MATCFFRSCKYWGLRSCSGVVCSGTTVSATSFTGAFGEKIYTEYLNAPGLLEDTLALSNSCPSDGLYARPIRVDVMRAFATATSRWTKLLRIAY